EGRLPEHARAGDEGLADRGLGEWEAADRPGGDAGESADQRQRAGPGGVAPADDRVRGLGCRLLIDRRARGKVQKAPFRGPPRPARLFSFPRGGAGARSRSRARRLFRARPALPYPWAASSVGTAPLAAGWA